MCVSVRVLACMSVSPPVSLFVRLFRFVTLTVSVFLVGKLSARWQRGGNQSIFLGFHCACKPEMVLILRVLKAGFFDSS